MNENEAVQFLSELFVGVQQTAALLQYHLARIVTTPINWAIAAGVVAGLKALKTSNTNGHSPKE